MQEFLENKTELEEFLLKYLDDDDNQDNNYKFLLQLIDKNKIREKRPELSIFLSLISNISKNHYRTSNFFAKIEKIILLLESEIKQSFSNSKIFNIFKGNKKIVLFLLQNKIIEPNKTLADIIANEKYQKKSYQYYFYPEFQTFFDNSTSKKIEKEITNQKIDNFDEYRKIGENENPICQLIRNDSIDDIISMINQNKIKYSSTIDQSIFETNPFLFDKNSSLIEYAAFYGSINIFNYLVTKKVALSRSLWLYAIHGNNLEIIKTIMKNDILPVDLSYIECFIEAIKCFHVDIAEFIKNKLKNKDNIVFVNCMKYFNFSYFPDQKTLNNNIVFYNSCKYNYFYLVESLINIKEIDVNFHAKADEKNEITPLIIAIDKENVENVDCLLKHPKINVNDELIFIIFIFITFH